MTVLGGGELVLIGQNGVEVGLYLGVIFYQQQMGLAGALSFLGATLLLLCMGRLPRRGDGVRVVEAEEGSPDDRWIAALRSARLQVELAKPIAPEQWTKLVVNLNNAISALSGAPTPEMLLSAKYRRAMTLLLDEALGVLDAAGIETAKFRGVPLRLMSRIFKLPTPIVRLVLRAQLEVDPESRASMYQDLERRRKTEVDVLNGEIVRLAAACGVEAPLNRRIVARVHEAEDAAKGCPRLDADALLAVLLG